MSEKFGGDSRPRCWCLVVDVRSVTAGVWFFMPDRLFSDGRRLVLNVKYGNVRTGVMMAGIWVHAPNLMCSHGCYMWESLNKLQVLI